MWSAYITIIHNSTLESTLYCRRAQHNAQTIVPKQQCMPLNIAHVHAPLYVHCKEWNSHMKGYLRADKMETKMEHLASVIVQTEWLAAAIPLSILDFI